jgi:hypothetical protein
LPSVGWRLVLALVALATLVMLVVALLSGAPGWRPRTAGEGAPSQSVLGPWAACVHEARRQFSSLRGVEIVGPLQVVWHASGMAVEVVGTALVSGGVRGRRFACDVILAGDRWHVERVVFDR